MTTRDSDVSAAGVDEAREMDHASLARQTRQSRPGWRGVLALFALILAAAAGYAVMFLVIDSWRGG